MHSKQRTTKSHFKQPAEHSDGARTKRNGPRIDDRGLGNVKTATRGKKRTVAKITMKSEVREGSVTVDLPLKTVSEANCFEPWQKKHGRHKDQQRIVALALNPLKSHIRMPCKIMLTRFAPNHLDVFDNLPMSLKYIVDAVCAIITGEYRAGKADGDKRISIACDQVKSEAYGVRITVTY